MFAIATVPRRSVRSARSAAGKTARLVGTLGALLLASGAVNLTIILADGGLR